MIEQCCGISGIFRLLTQLDKKRPDLRKDRQINCIYVHSRKKYGPRDYPQRQFNVIRIKSNIPVCYTSSMVFTEIFFGYLMVSRTYVIHCIALGIPVCNTNLNAQRVGLRLAMFSFSWLYLEWILTHTHECVWALIPEQLQLKAFTCQPTNLF